MSEMSFEDAAAAIGDAIETDAAPTPLETPAATDQAPVAPVTTPEGETSAPEVQPAYDRDELGRFARFQQDIAEEAKTDPAVTDTFDGGKFNPDELPEELQPGWKQLQAAFTQRTQELAEQRKQFDGIDAAEARQAVELYQALQDPNYLVQFHSQLSEALQAQGLTAAQADAQAAQELGTTQPQVAQAGDTLAALRSDPELAPLADLVQQSQNDLRQMQQAFAAERQQREVEQMELAIAGELMRQEAVLREQGFKDAHITRVKEMAAFHDGSLLDAAESFKSLREETLTEYLESKQSVEPGVGPVRTTTTSEVPTELGDMDEALKAALSHIEAAGIDTVI